MSYRGDNSNRARAANNSQGFTANHLSGNFYPPTSISIDTQGQHQQQATSSENRMVPFGGKSGGKMGSTARNSECIKVCVRVRPLLPHEMAKDEVVYYPTQGGGHSSNDHLEGIKVADGQHMIESKYDKVYSQRTEQTEIYQFVEGKKASSYLY